MARKERGPIEKDKLVEASRHLLYEIDMLRRNIETLRSIDANQNQSVYGQIKLPN